MSKATQTEGEVLLGREVPEGEGHLPQATFHGVAPGGRNKGCCGDCGRLRELDDHGHCYGCQRVERICADCGETFTRKRIHYGKICGRCRYYRREQGRNVKYRRPNTGRRTGARGSVNLPGG